MRSRILYVECKGNGLTGPARIGRVTFSKSGRTVYYRGKSLQPLSGRGSKANYFDTETREWYWVSGCRRDGADSLYPLVVELDDDVRAEYWAEIRGRPDSSAQAAFHSPGKHSRR
ncbi:MAG: 1-deoxy-D-xylulose-5-phosphate synthase [Fimbriiglobus sp.]